MNTEEKIFYLKVNRIEGYTLRNLGHWLRTIKKFEGKVKYYVICDNEALLEKIMHDFAEIYPEIKNCILKSRFDEELKHIVTHVTDARWEKAGYSHLTTFLHADEMGYSRFWNIDADDTRFCLSEERCKELLQVAEEYAENNAIDGFSLDMHATRIGSGKHWSFGITYINNTVKWIDVMNKYCQSDLSVEDACCNVDRFFRYIRNHAEDVKLESFYVENLKFFHYSNDFFWRIVESALYHWKDGYLTFPLLYYGVGLQNEKSKMPIDGIVKKLDIGVTDEESMISMLKACNSPGLYLRSLDK